MGRIDMCEICKLPVLELDGQFEVLQPYDGNADDPAFELVGTCHSTCLATSPHCATWVMWIVNGLLRRGYQHVREALGWKVLSLARIGEEVAVHESGCTVAYKHARLADARRCDGGWLLPVRTDMYYELPDPALVARWQQQLSSTGSIPIATVIDDLGLANRIRWPLALATGRWLDTEETREAWGPGQIGVVCEHDVFVPDVVSER